jgi:3-oxoacyl-[acyl-carrier protein] reductase
MDLKDKVTIVTGAGSGFGAAIARRFAAHGAKVLIVDLNEDAAVRVATDIGSSALSCKADVSKSDDVKAMVESSIKAFGRIDILVNNAGITHRRQPMLDVAEEEFDRVYAVNVKSIYLSALHTVPVFRKQGHGVFLNIASTAGVRPRPGLVWYNGSKSAVIGLTRSMAIELAEDNIRVNALNPVAGDTPLLKEFMGGDTPELREQFMAPIPLGRFSQPNDIAEAALYFCSDRASFITGVCMEVDGGRCI